MKDAKGHGSDSRGGVAHQQGVEAIPAHNGHITLASGKVGADIVAERGKFISIYEWSSFAPGAGNTVAALNELKARFQAPISVHDIGERGTGSFNYWKKMQQEGHVDTLLDAEDQVVRRTKAA